MDNQVTNNEIIDKVIEGSNLILRDLFLVKDELNPTYVNSRSIHQMVFDLNKKVDKMDAKLNQILNLLLKQ